MKYSSKIHMDRYVGIPIALGLNLLTRIVSAVTRPEKHLKSDPKTVAVAKYEGLGSILYTSVLCRALKKRFPESRLVYVTRKANVEMLRRIPEVDEVVTLDDGTPLKTLASLAGLLVRLWSLKIDLYFDMEVYSSFSSIIATLSRSRIRYGYYRKAATFKEGLHTHTIFFNTARHISEVYLQFAQAVGANEPDYSLKPFTLFEKDREACRRALDRLGVRPDARIVLINANASELLLERRWPVERWAEMIENFPVQPNDVLLLVGAKGEKAYVDDLYARLSGRAKGYVINAAGEFPLGAFFALIEGAALMVTCDTGPLHFAVALGCPTVSLWGPVSPAHYGPSGGLQHRAIYNPVYCSPCLHHADVPPCGGNNVCMKTIEVGMVLDVVRDLLPETRKYETFAFAELMC